MTFFRRPLVFTPYYFFVIFIFVLIAFLTSLLALSMGSVPISPLEIPGLLFSSSDELTHKIIKDIRLPRLISGFCVGGMLALAGCLMQVLLRNPLAEPYILGISSGASAFALFAIVIGISGIWVNFSAFAGAAVTVFLVFYLSGLKGKWNPLRTLLTGVVLAAGWGAVVSFLLSISQVTQIHGMLFWLMGDLSLGAFNPASAVVLIICVLFCLFIAKELNLLALGKMSAQSLGVSADKLTYLIYFLSSLLTATAVMQAGSIGFIGLIVPHLSRLIVGGDHVILIPVSVLLGGSLLIISDALARTILAPQQLPVGVLTAMLGVPIFLILLNSINKTQK